MDQYVHELSALTVAQDSTLIPADDGTTDLKKMSLLQMKSYINQETLTVSYPELVGIIFSTGGGAIWTAGSIFFENQSYLIAAGSTTNKYLYWDADTPNSILTSNTPPDGGDNCFTLAYYDASLDEIIELRSSLVFEGDRLVLSDISLDTLSDGDVYAKVLKTSIGAGKILLSECTGTVDQIADGTVYGKVLSTSISAGKILLSETVEDASVRKYTATEQTKLSGIDAGATEGATWGSNLDSIPTRFQESVPPAGTGLCIALDAMGYYADGVWKTYLDNAGNMVLGDPVNAKGMYWNQSEGSLNIRGSLNADDLATGTLKPRTGGLTIQTSADTNSGFKLDDVSIRGFNASGQKTIDLNWTGTLQLGSTNTGQANLQVYGGYAFLNSGSVAKLSFNASTGEVRVTNLYADALTSATKIIAPGIGDTANKWNIDGYGIAQFANLTVNGKSVSTSDHQHDDQYSAIHSHPYAASSHTHSGIYAVYDHNHDDAYAAKFWGLPYSGQVLQVGGDGNVTVAGVPSHSHSGVYAPVHDHPFASSTHDHSGVYSPVHSHPYASNTHNHDGDYAPNFWGLPYAGQLLQVNGSGEVGIGSLPGHTHAASQITNTRTLTVVTDVNFGSFTKTTATITVLA